ncbi:probable NOT transcription complex subunit VIP2 [Drosophila eugracilis]|uniref:probable NOT transcription complex subunit VIP2 n=1 Tax=Drosophila eugracilis TaxID=29029 RepID=UPI001BDA88E3|nr:probable NOT transcription complex subunit VIP2 [Drosophila eugracilis]
MNRQFSRIVDENEEKDKSPSPSNSPRNQSPLSSPESSPTTILYVDVVKNKPKLDMMPSPPPRQLTPPEFSIFREDFPALPGTAALPSASNSSVPDDWTSMLSEADQAELAALDELAEFRDITLSSDTNVNKGPIDTFQPESQSNQSKEKPMDVKYVPQFYEYLPSSSGAVSLIFSKQFIHEGVRQRALSAAYRKQSRLSTRIHPPPGFENTKIFSSLKTNSTGMPLGGVELEMVSPLYDRLWKMNAKSQGSVVEGSFGMLGLAKKLESIHRNPFFMPQLYGNDVPHNAGAGGNGVHSTFTGPFQGSCSSPHEMNYKVPPNYHLSGRLNLQQPKTEEMQVELLFFFFYKYVGDMMQMLVAAELAERGWRYHMKERLWINRQLDNPNYSFKGFQESGEYNYFNMCQWKILPRYFQLEPDHLERTLSKEELYEMHGYHPQMM